MQHGAEHLPLGQQQVAQAQPRHQLRIAQVGEHQAAQVTGVFLQHAAHARRVPLEGGMAGHVHLQLHQDGRRVPRRHQGRLHIHAAVPYLPLAPAGDMLRCPQRAHLRAVQRRAAGTIPAKGARRLAAGVQTGDVRLPVRVHRNAAVVVLGAHPYLQHFPLNVNAVAAVQLDGRGVDGPQALDGGGPVRAAVDQILPRFLRQQGQVVARRVVQIIHVHPAAPVLLGLDEDIHPGGALRPARVKGPLVALEEGAVHGLRRAQRVGQEIPRHTVIVDGYIAGQGLLVAAGHVPAEPN